jgi:hypothetical protein
MAGVGIPELLLLLWPLLRRLDQRLDKQRVLSDPIQGQQQDEKTTIRLHPEKQVRDMATLDYFGIFTEQREGGWVQFCYVLLYLRLL